MKIKYKQNGFNYKTHKYGEFTEIEDISDWIQSNLNRNGIESKIEKLISILSIVAGEIIAKNPNLVENVAYLIECEGSDHEIVSD